MTKRVFPLVWFLIVLGASPLYAQSLQGPLDKILASPALRGGITGAVVVRVKDGKTLYSHDAQLRLMPASNRKLFTAAAALGVLGDNYYYATYVGADGRILPGGVFNGDIMLDGNGDGALTTADLADMAAQIKQQGINHISGNIIGEGGGFSDGPYGFGWEWDDFDDEEFPKITALTINHGDVTVNITAGAKPGLPAVVSLEPPVASQKIEGVVTTAGEGPYSCSVTRAYGSAVLHLFGTIGMGQTFTQNIPVPDPPRYAAEVLQAELVKAGVTIDGDSGTPHDSIGGLVLASHRSVPLIHYLPLMLKPSDNLIAESLVRTLANEKQMPGDYAHGHAIETTYFKSIGINTDELDLRDGCGVSRRDYVTAHAVGQLLIAMTKRPDFHWYYDALPIAGVDGTLKTRFVGTKAQGNVHAKTGTLSQARALSGYFTGRDKQLYAFSLIMNNFPGDAKSAGNVQDKFVEYLVSAL